MRSPSTTLLALTVLALAAPATGSFVERTTAGVASYQFDAETHHDAPDTCDMAGAAWSLPVEGRTDGVLAPADDMSDVFVLDVSAADLGERITVELEEQARGLDVEFSIQAPGCITDVFAPEETPAPMPTPAEPGAGERRASPSNLAGPWECVSDRWEFKLTHVSHDAPASIHVAWTDGETADLPRGLDAGNARYLAVSPLDALVHDAWAILPADWAGDFSILKGPCDATDQGAVFGDPAVRDGQTIHFTPIRTGPHLIVVTTSDGVVNAAMPSSVPLSCHFCIDKVEDAVAKLSYWLSSGRTVVPPPTVSS